MLASIIIGGCFALTQFTLALYLPALAVLTHFFEADIKQLMLSLSIATFGYAMGQLFWGSLSDYIGRKPAYIIALSSYTIICLFIINTTNLNTFYGNMALLGFCASAFTCVGNAFIVDILGRQKAQIGIAYIGITMATASVINPVIGTHLLSWFNWQSIYVLLLVYSSMMLLGILFFVPETHQNRGQETKNLLKVYKTLFSHPQYMGYLLTLGMGFGCFLTYLAAAPSIYYHFFHATVEQYGWLFLLSSLTYLLGSILVRWRIEQWGHNYLLRYGLICTCVGGLLLLLMSAMHLTNLYSMTLPIAIILLGIATIISTTKVGAMSIFEHNKGTAASLMKFMQIAITTVITALAALIHITNNLIELSMLFVMIPLLGIFFMKTLILPVSISTSTT